MPVQPLDPITGSVRARSDRSRAPRRGRSLRQRLEEQHREPGLEHLHLAEASAWRQPGGRHPRRDQRLEPGSGAVGRHREPRSLTLLEPLARVGGDSGAEKPWLATGWCPNTAFDRVGHQPPGAGVKFQDGGTPFSAAAVREEHRATSTRPPCLGLQPSEADVQGREGPHRVEPGGRSHPALGRLPEQLPRRRLCLHHGSLPDRGGAPPSQPPGRNRAVRVRLGWEQSSTFRSQAQPRLLGRPRHQRSHRRTRHGSPLSEARSSSRSSPTTACRTSAALQSGDIQHGVHDETTGNRTSSLPASRTSRTGTPSRPS